MTDRSDEVLIAGGFEEGRPEGKVEVSKRSRGMGERRRRKELVEQRIKGEKGGGARGAVAR